MTRLIERGPFLLATALAAAIWAEPAAAVRSTAPAARWSFDGAWSVVIITDSGTCDRQYRYGLQISNGRVVYQGDPSINIAGRVDPNGRVAVVVRSGDQVASGAGRLSRVHGFGRWNGRSSTQLCSGHWVAERRA